MKLRTLFNRRRVEDEMEKELRFHLDQEIEENMRAGMDATSARRVALRRTGSIAAIKEDCRGSLGVRLFDELRQDLRHGVRALLASPGFTLTAVLTLALGIGANSAIFTLLDAVMFKPLAVSAPAELAMLYEHAPNGVPDAAGGTGRYLRFSYPRFKRLAAALGNDGSLAAVTRTSPFVVTLPGTTERREFSGQLASGNYFSTLRVAPLRGRVLTPRDEEDAAPVAVASDTFWRRLLGGSDAIVGESITVNGLAVTVVGVAQPGFGGIWSDAEADFWLPVTLQHALHYQNNSSSYGDFDTGAPWVAEDRTAWLNLVGRLPAPHRAAAIAVLQAENSRGVAALAARMDPRDSMRTHTLAVESLQRGFSGLRARYGTPLDVLAALAAMVLLVSAVNMSNLLLIKGVGRAREFGIRAALGADGARLMRQVLTESLLLAVAGGAAGFFAGRWLSTTLSREVLAAHNALPAVFTPYLRVVAFTVAVSVVAALAFGIWPAVRAVRGSDRVAMIADRSAITGSPFRAMRPLVAGQIALALVVVFAATLLGHTLANLARLEPGFDVHHNVSASFDLAPGGLDPRIDGRTRVQADSIADRVRAAALAVPGVVSVAMSRCGLVAGCSSSSGYSINGRGAATFANDWVGADYFATVGIQLLQGREFDEVDASRRPSVAIISESIARRYFPDGALGQRINSREIVGVVRDARSYTLHDPPVPMVYLPFDAASFSRLPVLHVDVRVIGEPGAVVPALRDAFGRVDPALVTNEVTTMEARLARDLTRERIVAYLAAGFAALAIFLAALGLYGVLAYGVASRRREIGVRLALGATKAQVIRTVVEQSAAMTVAGVIAGLAVVATGGRSLQALLYGVPPWSPSAFALAAGVFALVAAVAAYLPARSAARVDPITALRCE